MKNIEKMSIDDKIEYWHTHETGNSLREFLGMTKQEYLEFCMDGIKTKTKKIKNIIFLKNPLTTRGFSVILWVQRTKPN